jgi:nitrite reductase (NADH) large subunit
MKTLAHRSNPVHYVIIGNSAAGITAAKEIRTIDDSGRITILSDESTFGYSRVLLPLYIAGKLSEKSMLIAPRSFYQALKICLRRQEAADAVDLKGQIVHTTSGKRLSYDRLLVATGSSARKLDVPGSHLRGVHYLRKMEDAKAIRADLASSRHPVLIVGGGLVSVKSAEALIARKKRIHLAISSDRILSQMLNKTASGFFLETFRKKGVQVHLHTDVKSFEGGERLERVCLSDGTTLDCNLAIIGKGVSPNTGLLRSTGISLDQGIVVDGHMATNVPSVYAAGDVAEINVLGRTSGNAIWPLAVEGGRVAGANMALAPTTLSGALRMNSIEVLGTRVISVGDWEGERPIEFFKKEGSVYRRLVFSGGRLQGFILAGDIRGAGVLTSLVKNQSEIASSLLEEGLDRSFSYWPRLQGLGGRVQLLEMERRQI